MTWKDAVRKAIPNATDSDGVFTLEDLWEEEGGNMIRDTGTKGRTPKNTIERTLQELRDLGEITFLDNDGTYRITGKFHPIFR